MSASLQYFFSEFFSIIVVFVFFGLLTIAVVIITLFCIDDYCLLNTWLQAVMPSDISMMY